MRHKFYYFPSFSLLFLTFLLLLFNPPELLAQSCTCNGGMVAITVEYNGPANGTVEVFEDNTLMKTFTNVQPGDTLTITAADGGLSELDNKTKWSTNGGTLYETHASCSQTILGNTYGDFTVIGHADKDNGSICGYVPPGLVIAPCECKGGMVAITVEYNGPANGTVEVFEDNTLMKTFTNVQPGDTLTITAADGGLSELDNKTNWSTNGGTLYETHASCSQEILGNTYGDFTVIGHADKDNGTICGYVPPGLIIAPCECKGGMVAITVEYNGPANGTVEVFEDNTLMKTFTNVQPGDTLTITAADGGLSELDNKTNWSTNGGTLYETHASCSQEILGNTYGDFTVIGHADKDNGTICGYVPPGLIIAPCDCNGGMVAITVEYNGPANGTVEVFEDNTLMKTFTNVQPGDTLTITAADGGLSELDNKTNWSTNGGTLYETHASCSQEILGNTYGDFTVIGHVDSDNGSVCGYVPPGLIPCPCDGGIVSLTFEYTGPFVTALPCECNGGMVAITVEYNGPANGTVEVFEDNTLMKTFTNVQPGDTLTITAADGGLSELHNKTNWSTNGGTLYETHASCSQEILGNTYGDFTVIGHADKDNGSICGYVPPGLVTTPCECKGGMVAITVEYNGPANGTVEVFEDNTLMKTFTNVQPGDTLTITAADGGLSELDNKTNWSTNGGTLYETHASCSQEILGNTYGDFTVIGHADKDNGTICGYVPPGLVIAPCECKGGMVAITVEYNGPANGTVEVFEDNTLMKTFTNVQPGDTLTITAADGGLSELDNKTNWSTNGGTMYETHASCSQEILGNTYGDFTVIGHADKDNGTICGYVPPGLVIAPCDCNGGMVEITVEYNGPANGTVEVFEDNTLMKTFTNVQPGDTLTIKASDGGLTELDNKTNWSTNGGTLYETHASCSQEILGNTYGDFTVIGHEDKNGSVCGYSPSQIFVPGQGVTISVYEKSGKSYLIQTFTNVQPGDILTVFASSSGLNKFGSNTYFVVDGGVEIEFHTSCSQDIVGTTIDNITITGQEDEQGNICETPASVGNCVFSDDNKNGIQDQGEVCVPGITVKLFTCDGNGNPTGQLVATLVTDQDGKYLFDNLAPGEYYVLFEGATLPTGASFTLQDQGGDDALDSDVNANGQTDCFTLEPGKVDTTRDAGITICTADAGTITIDQDPVTLLNGTATISATPDGNQVVPTGYTQAYVLTSGPGLIIEAVNTVPSFTVTTSGQYTIHTLVYDATPTSPDFLDLSIVQFGTTPASAVLTLVANNGICASLDAVGAPVVVEDPASLGDLVFEDLNRNGQQDAGEPGVQGVTVELYMCGMTTVLATDVTDANGNYLFENLEPNKDYYVVFSNLPTDYVFSDANQGNDATDSDAGPNGETGCYTLDPGENELTVDAGINLPAASLGDQVFEDLNRNGQQDPGEPGVPGVIVELYTCDGNGNPTGTLVATDITDANGNYLFDDLDPGEYYVVFDPNTLPTNFSFTLANIGNDMSDSDADATGQTACVELDPGEDELTIDAGISTCTADAGTITIDQDPVTLTNGTATISATPDGNQVVPTGYTQAYVLTSGPGLIIEAVNTVPSFTVTTSGQYTIHTLVYDATPTSPDFLDLSIVQFGTTPASAVLTLVANNGICASLDAVGAPVVVEDPASLGDLVFEDLNRNGQQDAGEPGVQGVTVELYMCGMTTVLATDVTDANGNYLFENLEPNKDYYVVFSNLPTDYVFSDANQGNDATDSDAGPNGETGCYTLDPGENELTVDAGINLPAASLGDLVFEDLNRNGQQDAGEPGVQGVTVELYMCGMTTVLATDVTDANGNYLFENLEPNKDYYVVFSNLPTDYVFSDANQGNDATDSDAGPNGETGCYTLDPGENELTVDAGINLPAASLGDLVFEDLNRNGQQDAGEPGVQGVTVELYMCGMTTVLATDVTDANGNYLFENLEPNKDYYVVFSNLPTDYVFSDANQGNDATDSDAGPNGETGCYTLDPGENELTVDAGINLPAASLGDLVFEDLNRNGQQDAGEPGVQGVTVELYMCGMTTVLATDVTDANGNYLFENLEPNKDYYVVFSNLPTDYVFSDANQGNDATDSDAGLNGETGCYTLDPGENELTVDAGINLPAASLGDLVFEDLDEDGQQDAGEPGVQGVTVKLYMCGMTTVLASDVTDANGNYLFENLEPNKDYYVVFDLGTLPAGYEFTSKDQGNDATDSDAGPNGETGCYTLDPGENELTVDAGIKLSQSTCVVDAGTLTIDCPSATFCRQYGEATVVAQPDGNVVVPTGYTVAYLFTEIIGGNYVIRQIGSSPSFIATYNADYGIHTIVYDGNVGSPEYFDISTIVIGTTTIADVYATLEVGGGTLCGDLDQTGAVGTVIKCSDPRANDDFVNTLKDMSVTGNLLTNDVNPYGHPLWLKIIVSPDHGTFIVDQLGNFTYTPNPGFVGEDAVRYNLRDTTLCNDRNGYGWLYIEVIEPPTANVNDVPIANSDMSMTLEAQPVILNVMSNDIEPDGDQMTISALAAPDSGSVVYNPDNTVTYIPNAGIVGEDVFTYQICDGAGNCDVGRVRVLILEDDGQGTPPFAGDDAFMVPSNLVHTSSLNINDIEVDGDVVTYSILTQPQHGLLLNFDPTNGSYTYLPAPSYNGSDEFVYQASDVDGFSIATAKTVVSNATSVFPVEWLSFHAEQDGRNGLVTWMTGSELNTSHYEVERSLDATLFERVGNVVAVGTTQGVSEYTFVDPRIVDLDETSIYYRLRQVDIDGNFSFSSTVELQLEVANSMKIEVYPTPASNRLSVEWTDLGLPAEVNIYDGLGQLIESRSVEGGEFSTEFNVAELASGVYYIQVSSGRMLRSKSFEVRN